MRKIAYLISVVLLVGCAAGAQVCAGSGKFGVGIMVGEPTGVSAKLWLGKRSALDAAAAWSFRDNGTLCLHAGYLYHFLNIQPAVPDGFCSYAGAGAKLLFRDETAAGLRIPLGLIYSYRRIELFLEIAPSVLFVPDTAADLDGGAGIRFYF
jgi:hypothetical protein